MTAETHADELVAFLDEMADVSGRAILPWFRQRLDVENKLSGGAYDPVTVADKAAEEAMRRLLAERYPEHGILGEEYGREREDAEHVWVLDPIDGTRAFISGLPVWGTLIGLTRAKKPVLGMMHQPFTGERYVGDGARAWYRGPDGARDLKARLCERLEDAVLFTTSPSLFVGEERAAFDRIESTVRLSRYGVDCYAYCMVAAGFVDAVIESGLKPYDIVALIPVIEGAGGLVTDWRGQPVGQNGGQIAIAGDRACLDEALVALRRSAK